MKKKSFCCVRDCNIRTAFIRDLSEQYNRVCHAPPFPFVYSYSVGSGKTSLRLLMQRVMYCSVLGRNYTEQTSKVKGTKSFHHTLQFTANKTMKDDH